MKKPVVFFDFDDTKIDTIPVMVEHINLHFGIACTSADFRATPSLELVLNRYLPPGRHLTREQAYMWLATDFLCSLDIHETIPLIEGVTEVLPLIARRYEIWTVTARQKVSLSIVNRLLEKHVPGCVTGIHCVWDRRDGVYHGVPKKDFIARFDGRKTAFFDDSPTEIIEVGEIIPSYLFDPHGHHDHRGDINLRVRSWKDIGKILL